MRRAKIVATLGPATSTYEMVRAIIDAGVEAKAAGRRKQVNRIACKQHTPALVTVRRHGQPREPGDARFEFDFDIGPNRFPKNPDGIN